MGKKRRPKERDTYLRENMCYSKVERANLYPSRNVWDITQDGEMCPKVKKSTGAKGERKANMSKYPPTPYSYFLPEV